MNTKHTPGPWTVSGGTIRNLHGHLVADFHSTDADARLIAAAPELLAALRSIADSDPDAPEFIACAMAVARAAIAKAGA
jgi:hypothetical protein